MSSINEKIIINKMNKPELIGNIHWRTCFEAGASLNLLNLSVS